MAQELLPEPFADLKPWVSDWALATEPQRNRKRIGSTMAQLRAFYDAVLPRMEALILYLKPLGLGALSAPQRNLLLLGLMFMEVAGAIEVFFDPDVPDSYPPEDFHILPPFSQTAAGARPAD